MTDSPTPTRRGRIVALNRDLFFGVRIGNQLRALGWDVSFHPTGDRLAQALAEQDGDPPVLVLVDMSAPLDWDVLAGAVAATTPGTPILAFGPHVDVDGRRAAKAAGVTRIVSNGDFHRDMVALVERYARPVGTPGVAASEPLP